MKEEILNEMRRELAILKHKNEELHKKISRIKELEKDPKVEEYISLKGLEKTNETVIIPSDKDLVALIYNHYLYNTDNENESKVFIYLGTFKISDETDIVHGSPTIRVKYDSEHADYRLYRAITAHTAIVIPIKDAKRFEEENIVLDLRNSSYSLDKKYYDVQKEYFQVAVTESEEKAKQLLLGKYNRINSK